ncbi:MAG: sulfatase-like hydrolase/transferase [Acidobacteria bacterium]|nr:sulfatase-like hydrolase/transferase [Acidobacteriota bacterium]
MKRRALLQSLAAAGSLAPFSASAQEPQQRDPAGAPNILLLMTDQQRPDSLGCYGSKVAITPHIDRLANQGVRFENCYVQNPLCCPSRYSMLTGRYPHSHGVRSNWYAPRPGETSFGHQLSRAGYNTALIGKMHFTPWHDLFGFGGRIIAEAKFAVNCPDDYERFLRKHGFSRRQLYDLNSAEYIRNATAVKSKLPQELHIDSFVGRSICEYLASVREPFCLMASFLSPHNPYDPPKPYDELFLKAQFPPRNMYPGEVEEKPKEAYHYINRRLGWPHKTDQLTPEQLQITKAYYYSTCTLVDDWVGRVMDVLKRRGLDRNTIVLYTSDHGDLLGDHGLIYKQCFYEQSVKVPLIVHAPGRFAPRVVDAPVEGVDIFNTVCDLARAWPGRGRQGKRLVPLLDGRAGYIHREAVFSENHFGRMVRHGQYKMVYYPGRPYGELYDLAEDPDESRNLWSKLEGSEIKRRLKDLLLDWAFTSEDEMPLPVRADHFDEAPLEYGMVEGRTELFPRQSWYFEDLLPLYSNWEFREDGRLR